MLTTNVTLRKRATFLFVALSGLLGLLVLRLFWVQVVMGDELSRLAEENRMRDLTVDAKRGTIYDRNMQPLAVSINVDSVVANPTQVRQSKKAEEVAGLLAEVLEMDRQEVLDKITKSNTGFVYVKRKVEGEKTRKLKVLQKDGKLPGITFVPDSRRFYEKGKLASHILGFSGTDNQGLAGIEVTYDRVLRGTPGKLVTEYDAAGREMPQATHKLIPPADGNNLVLTIDEVIQYVVERELDKVVRERQPKGATIIVMDVKTGRILAMGSRPDFDPARFGEFPQANWRNLALNDAYEPGSTFKIVTAAAALEEGAVKPGDRFFDPGYIKVGDRRVECWKDGGHGSQSFEEVVQNSCNPGFITIGQNLGLDKFYNYLTAFGFGQPTGIELPGEATGILVPKKNAKPIDLATMSIGQANAVTPIQLITAVSAVANGGKLMQPQIIEKITDSKGEVVKTFEPKVVRQVISKEVAQQLNLILESVVSDGTGRNAYIEGMRVAGKTGTAQKINPNGGGYLANEYVASFIGFAPANDPQYACLVVVDAPAGLPYYGGQVAAPIFKNVMADVLRYLKVQPQQNIGDPEKAKAKEEAKDVTVPDLTNLSHEEAERKLVQVGLLPLTEGLGEVVMDQMPKPGARVKEGTSVILYLGETQEQAAAAVAPGDVPVPDLQGRSIREVGELLGRLGLQFSPVGSGLATKQSVRPGVKVRPGTIIQVEFLPSHATLGP